MKTVRFHHIPAFVETMRATSEPKPITYARIAELMECSVHFATSVCKGIVPMPAARVAGLATAAHEAGLTEDVDEAIDTIEYYRRHDLISELASEIAQLENGCPTPSERLVSDTVGTAITKSTRAPAPKKKKKPKKVPSDAFELVVDKLVPLSDASRGFISRVLSILGMHGYDPMSKKAVCKTIGMDARAFGAQVARHVKLGWFDLDDGDMLGLGVHLVDADLDDIDWLAENL